jgi:hypothetical protein
MKWLIDPVVRNTLVHGARQFCMCILNRRFHKLFPVYFHIPQYFFLANCQFLWKAFLISSTRLQVWLASKEEPCKRILFVGNVCLWLWWESTYWLHSCVFSNKLCCNQKVKIHMHDGWLTWLFPNFGRSFDHVRGAKLDGRARTTSTTIHCSIYSR